MNTKTIFICFIYLNSILVVSAEQSPSDFMKAWVATFNQSDANKILAYYDSSEETDCFVSMGRSFKGYKKISQMYQQDMTALRFYDSTSEAMKHRIVGEAAVVSFIHKFKYVIKETNVHYRIHIRTTVVLKKDKNSWKIISEHSSPIKGIERAKVINAT